MLMLRWCDIERCDSGGCSRKFEIDIPAEFTDLVAALVDLLPVEGEAES